MESFLYHGIRETLSILLKLNKIISIRDFIPKLGGIPVSLKYKLNRELISGIITIYTRHNEVIVGIANEILNGRDFLNCYGKPRTYYMFRSTGEVDGFIKNVTLQVGNSQIQVKETW